MKQYCAECFISKAYYLVGMVGVGCSCRGQDVEEGFVESRRGRDDIIDGSMEVLAYTKALLNMNPLGLRVGVVLSCARSRKS
jgi:hypothetical protein